MRGTFFGMAEHFAPDQVTRKDTLTPCALKIVCYNADTRRNKLSRKGLPVNRARLFRNVRLVCLTAALVAGGFWTSEVDAQSSRQRVTHTVRRGETLSTIASRYGTTVSALKRANNLRTSSIKAGRRIVVYTRQASAPRTAEALREVQQPRFKFDDSGALVPDPRAEAAIIYDVQTGKVLWESHAQDQRSIASITKVMTAVVFLEDSPDLSEAVVIQRADMRGASTTYLKSGDKVTKEDLLHLMLIASDNAAARVLARSSSYGADGFVARMNQKARDLGLTSTTYADTSGLLAANVSSAYDMARLITYVSSVPQISNVMQKQEYTVTAGRRRINIHTTNQLVRQGDVEVLAGKTGFISKAGHCLATLLRLPQGGPQIAVVVLGAKSNAGRFWETRHLFNWLSSKAQDLFGGTPVEAAVSN
jgi:D-alanyl-D-alanine endopeptidase (penicillin-binding protein 7)